jgi:hypothetical protein
MDRPARDRLEGDCAHELSRRASHYNIYMSASLCK